MRLTGTQLHNLFPQKPIIGTIHLPALPGAPRNDLSTDELLALAVEGGHEARAARVAFGRSGI